VEKWNVTNRRRLQCVFESNKNVFILFRPTRRGSTWQQRVGLWGICAALAVGEKSIPISNNIRYISVCIKHIIVICVCGLLFMSHECQSWSMQRIQLLKFNDVAFGVWHNIFPPLTFHTNTISYRTGTDIFQISFSMGCSTIDEL